MKLCYVNLPWCYFTTQELSEQWGDDWDDAPYEHNAGEPYKPVRPDLDIEDRVRMFPDDWNEDGSPKWKIKKIAIGSIWLDEPSAEHDNSPYSVEDINGGRIPWLYSKYEKISIMAGCNYEEFIKIIKEKDGKIYEEKRNYKEMIYEKKGRDPVFKCSICGKFIAYKDIDTPKVKRVLGNTVDTALETVEFYHTECDKGT